MARSHGRRVGRSIRTGGVRAACAEAGHPHGAAQRHPCGRRAVRPSSSSASAAPPAGRAKEGRLQGNAWLPVPGTCPRGHRAPAGPSSCRESFRSPRSTLFHLPFRDRPPRARARAKVAAGSIVETDSDHRYLRCEKSARPPLGVGQAAPVRASSVCFATGSPRVPAKRERILRNCARRTRHALPHRRFGRFLRRVYKPSPYPRYEPEHG